MARKYLRVDVDDNSPDSVCRSPEDFGIDFRVPRDRSGTEATEEPESSAVMYPENFIFVDLYETRRQQRNIGAWAPERLREAIHLRKNHLADSECVLFRWPWLALDSDQRHDRQIEEWLNDLVGNRPGEGVLPDTATTIGAVQHCVGEHPVLHWARSQGGSDQAILDVARAVETGGLIERGNAFWKPTKYHYILPSGEHTDCFVRIGDALRTPQDAYVMACWLTPYLVNDVAIIADTSGLNALLIQLEEFLARSGSAASRTVVLPEYEVSKPVVRRLLENALASSTPRFLGLQSVNSTGSLRELLAGELARVSDGRIAWSLDVLVDRAPSPVAELFAESALSQHSPIWLGLNSLEGQSELGSCSLCNASNRPQPIHINPRNYREIVLPSPSLVMPAIGYAVDAQAFWTRVSAKNGIAIEARPHPGSLEARGKHQRLPVRPLFELIAEPDGLDDFVRERVANLRRSSAGANESPSEWVFDDVGLVVANAIDIESADKPDFVGGGTIDLMASARIVLRCLGIGDDVPIVARNKEPGMSEPSEAITRNVAQLDGKQSVLLFSWGAVTGLNLRLSMIQVSRALDLSGKENPIRGLVFHSRPAHPSDWQATSNSFKPSQSTPSRLKALWTSSFPWSSPLMDEYLLLDRVDFDSMEISDIAASFLEQRKRFLRLPDIYGGRPDDWSPRFEDVGGKIGPRDVFWGMSASGKHQMELRGQSLYGNRLDPVTAYAAIGSTINHTRHSAAGASAPRWIRFDLARIVHSYYDAVIVCSILRWLNPGEINWESEPALANNATNAMKFLIEQVQDSPEEKIILLPELLLADVQGKIPPSASEVLREVVRSEIESSSAQTRDDIGLGALEIGLVLAERQ